MINIKNISLIALLIATMAFAGFKIVDAFSGSAGIVNEAGGIINISGGEVGSDVLGGVTMEDEYFLGDVDVAGKISSTGLATLSGGVVTDVGSITATTTLTTASANVQLLAASAVTETITLPAATDGARFQFVVTGALTGATVVVDSAEGDNINGAIMVNDAWVNCVDEDQINFITDGELIGDNIEMISDGTGWYIVSSEVDASAKMTCTDPS